MNIHPGGVRQARPQQSGGKGTNFCAQVKIRYTRKGKLHAIITMGAGKSLLFTKKQLSNFKKWLGSDHQYYMAIRIRGKKNKKKATAFVRDNFAGIDSGRLDLHIGVRLHLVPKPDGCGGITHSYFIMFQKNFRNSTD